jgi:hypothetical protein
MAIKEGDQMPEPTCLPWNADQAFLYAKHTGAEALWLPNRFDWDELKALADRHGVKFYVTDDQLETIGWYDPATEASCRNAYFSSVPPPPRTEPKQETWRDRAIRDPML